MPYVTVFAAVSPDPRGTSAQRQAIHCAVLHSVLGEFRFVTGKALRPMALENCANCTLIPFPFHLSDFSYFFKNKPNTHVLLKNGSRLFYGYQMLQKEYGG